MNKAPVALKLCAIEIKRYLTLKLLAFIAVCVLLSLSVVLAAAYGLKGANSAGFSLPVVDLDRGREMDMLISMYNNQQEISNLISIDRAELDEAQKLLEDNTIPGYVVVPKGFGDAIRTGKNTPVTVVLNRQMPVQAAAIVVLMEAGSALVSSSQSGVYAVYDYALSRGMSYEEIDEKIMYPINLKFLTAILNFGDYFDTSTVYPTGNLSVAGSYAASFALFFAMLVIFPAGDVLMLSPGLCAFFKLAGISPVKQAFISFGALAVVLSVFLLPLIFILGPGYLAAALAVAAIVQFVAAAFGRNAPAYCFGLSIFMLFVSGGIIPKAYLPPLVKAASVFTVNHWALSLNSGLLPIAVLLCTTAVFVAATTLRIKAVRGQ